VADEVERILKTDAVMRNATFKMQMRHTRTFGFAFVAAFAFCLLHFELRAHAQHETASDIEDGSRVFRQSCANCHGPDGNEIPGIDLGRGVFKTAKTDEDLIRIIQKGVPGTPMPPTNMSEEQAKRVVAYLRSIGRLGDDTSAVAVLRGWLSFLASGQEEFLLINLEDLWLETEPQNVPGTWQERFNWQRKTRYSLEQIRALPEVLTVLRTIGDICRRMS